MYVNAMPDQKIKSHFEGKSNTNIKILSKEQQKKDTLCDFDGHFDSRLTQAGWKQSRILSSFFKNIIMHSICLEPSKNLQSTNMHSINVHIHYYIHFDSKSPTNKAKFSSKLNFQWGLLFSDDGLNGSMLAIKKK